jgi:putative transposase
VTREPTPAWVVQQLRDVLPGDGPHRFMLFDHDSTFDGNVTGFMKATGLDPTRTGIQAPWQNGSPSVGSAVAGASYSTRSSR